jgi:hypothetical protein
MIFSEKQLIIGILAGSFCCLAVKLNTSRPKAEDAGFSGFNKLFPKGERGMNIFDCVRLTDC